MARQKNEEKRQAILRAAAAVIAKQGLGAPTASIAKEAGVADGTLFIYFPTKADLFDQLYRSIKEDMIAGVQAKLPANADLKSQFSHIWTVWTGWGVQQPAQRKALAQLSASDLVTAASRQAAVDLAADSLAIIAAVSAAGALKDAPAAFVGALVEAMATTTMDSMAQEPEHADARCAHGFAAVWNALSNNTQ
jgi:AcrR family transcriptional regulator